MGSFASSARSASSWAAVWARSRSAASPMWAMASRSGPRRRVLAALALDLRRRVEVGLLAGARGGDVRLLLVHRRIDHDVGAIYGRALGAVGGHGVGVLRRGSLAAQGGAVEVVAADLDAPGLVDALKDDPPALGVDLGDLPALAVVDAGRRGR